MAEHSNKLTVIDVDGTVYHCSSYTYESEATPTQIPDGDCLQVKNNNTIGYFGLWPCSAADKSKHSSPLRVIKNGIMYFIETEVSGYMTIKIPKVTNQSIKLEYIDTNGNSKTVTTKAGGTYKAKYGSAYKITIIPDEGYTAGSASGSPLSGYATDPVSISVSAATKKTFPVTINQTANQIITVTCNGTPHTGTFTGEYGDTLAFSIAVTDATKYTPGVIKVNGSTVLPTVLKEGLVVTATDANLKTFTVTIKHPANATITVTAGTTAKTSTFTANYGTSISCTIGVGNTAQYTPGKLTVDGSNYTGPFSLTKNVTITATATTTRTYTLTVVKNANASFAFTGAATFNVSSGTGSVVSSSIPYGTINYSITVKDGYTLDAINGI